MRWISLLLATVILTGAFVDTAQAQILRNFPQKPAPVYSVPSTQPYSPPVYSVPPAQPYSPYSPPTYTVPPGQPYAPYSPPTYTVPPAQPYSPGPPLVLPPVFPTNRGQLENFLEDLLEGHFGKAVRDIDVFINRNFSMEIEVDTPDHFTYLQVRQMVHSMPQLAGYQINVIHRNLEQVIERKIEKSLGPWVDDVDVDVRHRKKTIDIEVELRHPGAYHQLQQVLASMPELAGYQVRLRVEYD